MSPILVVLHEFSSEFRQAIAEFGRLVHDNLIAQAGEVARIPGQFRRRTAIDERPAAIVIATDTRDDVRHTLDHCHTARGERRDDLRMRLVIVGNWIGRLEVKVLFSRRKVLNAILAASPSARLVPVRTARRIAC